MKINYDRLKKVFGNHTEVAKALKITPRHYRRIRSGKFKPGFKVELQYVRLKRTYFD